MKDKELLENYDRIVSNFPPRYKTLAKEEIFDEFGNFRMPNEYRSSQINVPCYPGAKWFFDYCWVKDKKVKK